MTPKSKPPRKRFCHYLRIDVIDKIRVASAAEDRTISQMIEILCEESLARREKVS